MVRGDGKERKNGVKEDGDSSDAMLICKGYNGIHEIKQSSLYIQFL